MISIFENVMLATGKHWGFYSRKYGHYYCSVWIVGIGEFCSPDNRINVSSFSIPITSPNGMCSYGIGNVGSYNSSFTSAEIADQAFDNPAGHYDYEQLLEQAMGQSYIVTDLFESPNISETLYFTFLPNETVPSIEFLSASPPTAPPTVAPSPTSSSVPTNLSVSSIPLPAESPTDPNGDRVATNLSVSSIPLPAESPTDPNGDRVATNLSVSSIPLPTASPTDPNGGRVGSRGSAASVVYSCSITAMLVCSIVALLF